MTNNFSKSELLERYKKLSTQLEGKKKEVKKTLDEIELMCKELLFLNETIKSMNNVKDSHE